MCAGIGTQLFPSVKWGLNLTRQVNFTSFTRSFLLLLQTMTGMLLSPSQHHGRVWVLKCLFVEHVVVPSHHQLRLKVNT